MSGADEIVPSAGKKGKTNMRMQHMKIARELLRIAKELVADTATAEPAELAEGWNFDLGTVINTSHYDDEYHQRRQDLIDAYGGMGEPIAEVYMDKGHPNGPEVHILTDNAIIIVVNYRTKRLITTKFARPGQIRQLYGHLDLCNGRVFGEKYVPKYVLDRAIKYSREQLNQW